MIPMGNDLYGFGGTSPKGVNIYYVATPYVSEQTSDRCLLRRNGNVYFASLHQVHIGGVIDEGNDLIP